MKMNLDDYQGLTKVQYFFIIAVSFLLTLGIMGLWQFPFDLVLGLAQIGVVFFGLRGLTNKKKNYLFLFMWAMVGLGFLHVISLAVVIILHHKNKENDTRFGFIPDVILDGFKIIYSFGLSFYTSYIRNTMSMRQAGAAPRQMARI